MYKCLIILAKRDNIRKQQRAFTYWGPTYSAYTHYIQTPCYINLHCNAIHPWFIEMETPSAVNAFNFIILKFNIYLLKYVGTYLYMYKQT